MLLVSSRRSEEVGAEACLQVRGVHAHSVVFVRAVMSEADSGLTADSTRPGSPQAKVSQHLRRRTRDSPRIRCRSRSDEERQRVDVPWLFPIESYVVRGEVGRKAFEEVEMLLVL